MTETQLIVTVCCAFMVNGFLLGFYAGARYVARNLDTTNEEV